MKDKRQTLQFVSIITTYRCAFRCHMCNIWHHPTNPCEEIQPCDLEKLPHISSVNITGGEPFLRTDLPSIVEVLRRKAQRLVVSTNGFHTDRIVDLARKSPGIGIRISVEGLPTANDELRGVPGGFEHALTTLAELSHLGLKDIGFGITLSDRNAESLIPLYRLAKMLEVEFATAAVHNSFYFHKSDNCIVRTNALSKALDVLIDEMLRSRKPKEWFRAYFNWGLRNYINGGERLLPCTMGNDCCFIDPSGEVLGCNGTEESVSFGNIRTSSFENIWNGPNADLVRNRLRNCHRNCWMMGSVAQPMKDNLPTVVRWILARKFGGRFSTDHPSCKETEQV